MSIKARSAATGLLVAAALVLCSCVPPGNPAGPARAPNGSREALRAGHWRGAVKTTLVDFHVDRISSSDVAIHISGGLMSSAKDSPEHPVSFVDRPTTCRRKPDGYAFDCLRYKDMHIDNGFLCGIYALHEEIFRVCLGPIR